MKKIYYLVLLLTIGLSYTSFAQVTQTLATQTFDGTSNNWDFYTSPSQTPPPTTYDWAVFDVLDNNGSGGNLGTVGTAGDGDSFFGVNSTVRRSFTLTFVDADVTDYTDLAINFDYSYYCHNVNTIPTCNYIIYADGNPIFTTTFLSQALNLSSGNQTATVPISIPNNGYTTLAIEITINYTGTGQNFDRFVLGLDNFNITSTTDTFDGLVYQNDTDGWLNGIAPDNTTGSENAIILEGTYQIDSEIILNDIYTEDGAGVTINPTGNLTINGTIDTNNNLLIESDSQNYGSIIANDVLGSASYSRHVNGATSDLISSPVPGESFAEFVVANSSNIIPVGTSQARFGPYLKDSGSYINWSTLDLSNIIEPGVGYRTQTSDGGNFLFSGTIETGQVDSEVAYLDTYASQWNLIGNPYPSYLDIAAFISNTNNLSLFQTGKEAIYGYDGNASDGWLIYNLSTGVQMTPGQGFFVAVPSTVPLASMQFTPEMRTHGPGDDFISGRTTDIHKTHFKLSLLTGETTRHTSLVYFNDIASLGFDKGYDATLYGNNSSGYTMFTQLVEDNPNFKIGIQTLPNSNFGTGISIPLGIIAPKGEQITLDITESTLNEGATVYLEDTKTNTWTLLSDKPYTFTTDTKLNGLGRFILHTTDESRLSIEDNTLDQLQIFTGEQSIKLKGQLDKNTTFAIYDIQGRQMNKTVLNTTVSEYTLSTRGYASGIYIVSIKGSNGNSASKRVILK